MVTYDFSDDVVLVTGGARGLGQNHCIAFAEAGADVVVLDLRDTDPVISDIKSLGVHGLGLDCDVTDEASVKAAVETTIGTLGSIDVLVNNAGITRFDRLLELDVETWQTVINTNLVGTWLCAKHVARHMIDQENGGRIVNTGSFLGHQPVPGLGAYSVSKFGVRAVTRTLALELAEYDICVNAVSPIGVRTELVEGRDEDDESYLEQGKQFAGYYNVLKPGARIESKDVTGAVLWLSSEDSRYITGVSLPIDGGGLA